MPNRARDWLGQAVRDMDQAEDSRRAGRHEWACFAAQQAAELAAKALHEHLKQATWGHVVRRLLEALPALDPNIGSPDQYLIQHARWRLLDAIKRAYEKDGQVTREGVVREVAVTKDRPGILGFSVSFDEKGDAVGASFYIFQVVGDHFELVKKVEME